MNTSNLLTAQQEIKELLHDFYLHMQQKNAEEVYKMFSPNLRQLTIMEQYKEKYQSAFRFGRQICWWHLFGLTEIKPGSLEGALLLCLLSEDAKPSPKTKKFKEADMRYCGFRFQFIYLNEFWFVDDIVLYNDIFKNEFKDFANQQSGLA
jgi:hypothetical protein